MWIRHAFLSLGAAAVVGGLLLASLTTGDARAGAPGAAAAGQPAAAAAGQRQAQFAAAAREFGVPLAVLLATSYAQSRWEWHDGHPSTSGGYGPMHLTDAAVRVALTAGHSHHDDARGLGAAPGRPAAGRQAVQRPAAGRATPGSLQAAATLLDLPARRLKSDPGLNIRGGAALLARYQREAAGGRPTDPGRWYAAVARLAGSPDLAGARRFADDVYAVVRTGATHTTLDGQVLRLAPAPAVRPDRAAAGRLGLAAAPAPPAPVECPADLGCDFVPAAHAPTDPADKTKYGNYDPANRPADGSQIRYLVIHDTEGTYEATLKAFADPRHKAAAHYVIRSGDGHVTQMVPTRDVGWQAGNWYVNSHSVGIEHEGFAVQGATWYSEAMYRSSARLVRYLADRYRIPLDRDHVIGHDQVPGLIPAKVAGMHWDPGPYWDWDHLLRLAGGRAARPGPVPSPGTQPRPAPADANAVTIAPYFGTNRPPLTGCDPNGCRPLPRQPANFVYLRTAPADDAPLLADPAIHPGLPAGTTKATDWGNKAVSGQRFAVAERRGAWTAIWYAGVKAWFHDPDGAAAVPVTAQVVRARAGRPSVPVYGGALPEASAYPATIPPRPVVPLPYALPAGQAYTTTGAVDADNYYASTIDGSAPDDRTVVRGRDRYYPIQFNHRLAFVKASDVEVGVR
jgi:N-acetyl-anhydromuramyl-L-alanine amidase AmpD